MKNLRTALFAALGVAGSTGVASANAFNVNEHDARVTGRGGATAASNDDASSIVYNPAGVALGEGTQVILGTSLYIAEGSYENASTEKVKTDSPPTPVPNLYVTSRVHDMVAIGIGFHFPFGLAISYPEDGSHVQAGVAQDSDLRTLFISPVVGLNLHQQVPGLSLGAGVDIVPASVELKRQLVFGDTTGTADLAADTVGIGFRAGVMYHPPKAAGLKIGVMYRSPVKLDFEGEGDFDIADPFRQQVPPDGDVKTSITLPQQIWGGIAYSPVKNLEVEFNAVWINWSQTFKCEMSAENGCAGSENTLSIELPDGSFSNVREDYDDTVTYRLGLDYKLPKQKAAVRAGFAFDPTPIPDTTVTAQLPDADRIIITLGGSKQITPMLGADLSLLWVTPHERDSSSDVAEPIFHGTYAVQAFVVSLGLRGQFGGKPAPAKEPAGSVAKK